MIVVSNTSPLTNLAAIGQFELLRSLYGSLHIPDGVWEELNADGTQWPGSLEVASANWIYRHPVAGSPLVVTLRRDLDRGEAESIALAIQIKAHLVLLDEREGRRAAQRLGLRVIGVVGLLLDSKAKGLIPTIREQLDALRDQAGFFLSRELYERALQLANEA